MAGSLKITSNAKQVILNDIKAFSDKFERAMPTALNVIGIEAVNKARNITTYTDRTGNLRSSIGYVVGKKRSKLVTDIKAFFGKKESKERGEVKAQKLADSFELTGDYSLVIFAAMEYADYVERKGKDVLTGSMPSQDEFINTIKEYMQ